MARGYKAFPSHPGEMMPGTQSARHGRCRCLEESSGYEAPLLERTGAADVNVPGKRFPTPGFMKFFPKKTPEKTEKLLQHRTIITPPPFARRAPSQGMMGWY